VIGEILSLFNKLFKFKFIYMSCSCTKFFNGPRYVIDCMIKMHDTFIIWWWINRPNKWSILMWHDNKLRINWNKPHKYCRSVIHNKSELINHVNSKCSLKFSHICRNGNKLAETTTIYNSSMWYDNKTTFLLRIHHYLSL
jgi:hypothetical protein